MSYVNSVNTLCCKRHIDCASNCSMLKIAHTNYRTLSDLKTNILHFAKTKISHFVLDALLRTETT